VVKTGRRPPPQAAQRGLDHGEHGAMLVQIGITLSSLKHSCSIDEARWREIASLRSQ
jgi:hypothetical protein